MKAQKGSSVVEGLLILVIVGLLGFAGGKVWHSKNSTNQISSNAASSQAEPSKAVKKTATSATLSQETSTYANYMDVKEWGIRLSFDDADKVTYKIVTENSGTQFASLYLKDSVTTVEICRALGVGLSRDTKNSDGDNNIKIGNYYYHLGGGPGACEGYQSGLNSSINQLRGKIDGQELGSGKYMLTLIQ